MKKIVKWTVYEQTKQEVSVDIKLIKFWWITVTVYPIHKRKTEIKQDVIQGYYVCLIAIELMTTFTVH